MKKILFFCFIFLNFQLLLSQNFTQTIRGKIIDSQTEMPISGAIVIIKNTNPTILVYTETDGSFKFENIPVGRQSLEVSHISYLSYTQENIFVTSNKETVLEIKMEESVIVLNEMLIRSYHKSESNNQNASVSARTFSIEETERYAGSIGDPARMASNFAGIATICDQRNDIVIRGNSPLGVLWRLDGIEIPNPNHFASFGASGGPISMLNNNLLTNSDFFTGAFPAEYGNALSGVFDLQMRSGNNEKFNFVTQVGMNGFEIGAEGPILKEKLSFLLNYRYSTLAVVDAMGFKVGIDAIPFFQDATFKISTKYTKIGKFSLIGVGGYSYVNDFESKKDTSELRNGVGEDYVFGSGMGAIGVIHKLIIGKKINLENILSTTYTISHIQKDTFSIANLTPSIFYRQKSDEKSLTFSSNLKYKFNSKNNFQIGFSSQIIEYQFIDSIKKQNIFQTNLNKNGNYELIKLYAQWRHKFTDNLVFYSGCHYLLFTFNNKYSIEPRAGLKWSFVQNQSINFGFGVHSQLAPRTFYIVGSESDTSKLDEFNKNLGFSKSMQFVLGYNWLITQNFRFKVETYYQKLYEIPVKEGLPYYSLLNFGDSYFNTLPIIDSLVNEGKGKNYGVEFTLEKFLNKGYYFLTTVSLYESKYEGFNKIERNTAFNGNFIFNTLAGYEFKINNKNYLSFNLKTTFAGSLRYVPFEVEQIAPEFYIKEYDWVNSYEKRRNDYFRLNGQIAYKFITKKIAIELSIDFMNITNHKDIFQERFNSTTGEVSYSYQFSFLPIGFLRVQF